MDDGKIIRFTRYEEQIPSPMTEGEIPSPLPTLADIYKRFSEPTIFAHFGDLIDKPAPWWRRLWWWIDARYPRIHFGPCNHDECGYL